MALHDCHQFIFLGGCCGGWFGGNILLTFSFLCDTDAYNDDDDDDVYSMCSIRFCYENVLWCGCERSWEKVEIQF